MSEEKTLREDPNRGWRTWHLDEIYLGPDSPGIMVPNVDDAVFQWGETGVQRVISVDSVTKIPTLGPAQNIPMSGVKDQDVFIGNGGGHVSETYRLNVDKTTVPHRASLDSRLVLKGVNNASVRLFYGVDTTQETGQVISAYYNQSNELVSDAIPLEVVAMDDINNIAMKTAKTGSVTYDLKNGDLVTGVVYDNVGNAQSEFRLTVRNNTFTYSMTKSIRHITGIYLRSNFLSKTDDRTLLYPVNVPVADVEIKAVVKYSDTTEREVFVDGGKVSIFGLEDFISTLAGQRKPITLTYLLDDDETSTMAKGGAKRHISEQFYVTSIPMDGAYSVKLFVCPHWIDSNTGYELRYYLFNLDGTRRMDVTNYVQVPDDGGTFLPKAYGSEQRLTVILELNDAIPTLGAHRHIQNFSVTLLAPAHEDTTPWTINYTPGVPEVYGIGLFAATSLAQTGNVLVNLTNDMMSRSQWLNRMYYDTKPLYGGAEMPTPREPTHFELIVNNEVQRKPVTEWNQDIELPAGYTPKPGETAMIRWVLETPTNDIWLAIGALVLRDQTAG